MQERKDSAKGSANPSLDDDAADELAASFRPAWEVEEETEKTDIQPPPAEVLASASPEANTAVRPAPAAAAQASSLSKGTMIGLQPAPIPEQAKKVDLGKTLPLEGAGVPSPRVVVANAAVTTLDSSALVEATPSDPIAPQAPKTAPLPEHGRAGSTKATTPSAGTLAGKSTARMQRQGNAPAIATDPFAPTQKELGRPPRRPVPDGTEELAALVAKRPAKNYLFVAIGFGVAIGLGVFLKFALSDDGSKPSTPVATLPTTQAPMTPPPEIPPPPPKEEVSPPPATHTPVAKADPPPPPTPPAQPARAPEPPPRIAAAPPPRVAAPPPRAPAPPPLPPPRPAAKPGPGGASGGIVRDNPF